MSQTTSCGSHYNVSSNEGSLSEDSGKCDDKDVFLNSQFSADNYADVDTQNSYINPSIHSPLSTSSSQDSESSADTHDAGVKHFTATLDSSASEAAISESDIDDTFYGKKRRISPVGSSSICGDETSELGDLYWRHVEQHLTPPIPLLPDLAVHHSRSCHINTPEQLLVHNSPLFGNFSDAPDDVDHHHESMSESDLALLPDSGDTDANTGLLDSSFSDESVRSDDNSELDDDCTDDESNNATTTLDDEHREFQFSYSNAESLYTCEFANTPMHAGSQQTLLQGLAAHFDVFCNHPGISKETFSSYLQLSINNCIPVKIKLPPNYKMVRKMVDPYLTPKRVYYVCPTAISNRPICLSISLIF